MTVLDDYGFTEGLACELAKRGRHTFEWGPAGRRRVAGAARAAYERLKELDSTEKLSRDIRTRIAYNRETYWSLERRIHNSPALVRIDGSKLHVVVDTGQITRWEQRRPGSAALWEELATAFLEYYDREGSPSRTRRRDYGPLIM